MIAFAGSGRNGQCTVYLAGSITFEDSKIMSHLKKGNLRASLTRDGAPRVLNFGAVSLVGSGGGAEEQGSL